jgi:hypothetical protein
MAGGVAEEIIILFLVILVLWNWSWTGELCCLCLACLSATRESDMQF